MVFGRGTLGAMNNQRDPAGRRQVLSWALYDWANSAFATTVMAGFFPVFFKEFWSAGNTVSVSTFQLGAANSAASLVIVLIAPVLGSIADRGGAKKRMLLSFAALGVLTTGGLYLVGHGRWELAAALYGLGVIGFMGANVFYDALIVDVAGERSFDQVSALGYALGYLGGGLLFALNVLMTLWPGYFGLADAASAVRLSFVSVAVWWALFSLPLILFVREPRRGRVVGWAAVGAGFRQLAATFHEVRRLRVVFVFLVAYWLYIDGLDTIVRMSVDYGMALGFPQNSLIVALLITQFVGFPAAIAFGLLGERLGAKTGILIGIGVYMAVTVFAYFMEAVWEFYALAIVVGLVQGGVQSLSRSYYARLIPADKSAEFFGFYNMLGKFAAVLGPILMGLVSLTTGSPRLAILAVVVLFAAGAILLTRVDETEGRRMARELERI
ncbi:MAG TPA: MFS transporter [Gammaproteobacteria bacterium]|nr:MFS transporter [Gammaproteobacteria bacterium]